MAKPKEVIEVKVTKTICLILAIKLNEFVFLDDKLIRLSVVQSLCPHSIRHVKAQCPGQGPNIVNHRLYQVCRGLHSMYNKVNK